MNLKLPANNKVTIIISVLLAVALFAALFFFILYPKQQEIPLKERELASQQQLLSALQGKITETNSSTFQSTVELQKMVPVKPLSQQLLLDIEKAEVVSGSFVVNMVFEDSEVTITDMPANEQTRLDERIDEDLNPDAEGEAPEETIILPTGVKKISVTLAVESPSYFEFEKFISILENSERITVIENIDFTAGEEIIDYEQTDRPLNYQVRLSAFYMPTLSDLIDSLPKMESPEPANKKSPFTRFGDTTTTKQKEESSQVDSDSNSEKEQAEDEGTKKENEQVTEEDAGTKKENEQTTPEESKEEEAGTKTSERYTVKSGDTLTKIARKYYPSDHKYGINQIKKANQLKSDTIRPGQVLLIPIER